MSLTRDEVVAKCRLICFVISIVGIGVVVLGVVLSTSARIPNDASSDAPGVQLTSLEAEFYQWRQMDSPEFTTETGVHTYDNTVNDLSLTVFDTRKTKVDDFLRRLGTIPTTGLTRQERYSYEVFNDTLFTFSDNYKWRYYGPVNPLNFLEGDYIDPSYLVDIMEFETKDDYVKYLSRLQLYPTKFQQYITRFKTAAKLGHTNHRVSVEKIPKQIDDILAVTPETSTYYKPFAADLDKLVISGTEKLDLRTRASRAIVNLQKAYIDIKRYIQQDYLFQTRTSYGVLGLPNGKDNYRACLKWHISVDTTPEEVHQKGLSEVARISAEIQKIMNKRHYNGSIAQFYKQLREQPQFHLNTADELLKEYENMIFRRIYPQLPRAFNNIPNLNVTIEAMPNDGPGGMYIPGTADGSRKGVFQANLKRPKETNTFSMMALALHETVPGHHLQSIYALTAPLPDFQRNIEEERYYAAPYHYPFYTAYSEGWGLYAESLGEYLGIYKDDNELLGRYGEEIFRACRLVVDTGLHYYGMCTGTVRFIGSPSRFNTGKPGSVFYWNRTLQIKDGQEVRHYMVDHTPSAQSELEIEIDRYITWPGQACAYKIGELKILELRETAQRRLGNKFDIRDFHSQILENGPVPLSLLEEIINDWITETSGGSVAVHTTSNIVNVPLIPNLVG